MMQFNLTVVFHIYVYVNRLKYRYQTYSKSLKLNIM